MTVTTERFVRSSRGDVGGDAVSSSERMESPIAELTAYHEAGPAIAATAWFRYARVVTVVAAACGAR